MAKPELQSRLADITSNILAENTTHPALMLAVSDLGKLYAEILSSQEDPQHHQTTGRTYTDHGMALAPHEAISCLADLMRTVKFVRGVYAAILKLQERFPDEQLNVVYAGCGPLAPLVTSLCPLLDPDQISFTLLDIHEPSIECVKLVIEKLEIGDFFAEIACTDATSYSFPESKPLHLVVSETMQAGLQREPQVSIMHNFSKQLVDGGLIIPEEISINLTLADPPTLFLEKENAPHIALGEICKINQCLLRSIDVETADLDLIPASSVEIPQDIPDNYHFMLLTNVKIFEEIVLESGESGITAPLTLGLNCSYDEIERLNFTYRCQGTPQFEIDIKSR